MSRKGSRLSLPTIFGTFILIESLLFLEALAQQVETTAIISPGDYVASLDPGSSTTFQCHITGADSIIWVVDGASADLDRIRQRGITTSQLITLDLTEGRFTSNLTIPWSRANKNTTLRCLANLNAPFSQDVLSDPVYFQVQCLLGPPPNLTMITTIDEGLNFVRLLTWNEPDTLDITDVDPDITHYRVCYRMGASTTTRCEITSLREFTFVDVRVDVLFSVAAVNVVGEGNASTIMHTACGAGTETTQSTIVIQNVIISPAITLYGNTGTEDERVSVNLTFPLDWNVTTSSDDESCYDVYEVWTRLEPDSAPTKHGVQIPQVSVDSDSGSRFLSLFLDSSSGLRLNEIYQATVVLVNSDGNVTVIDDNIHFSTYDVQSVHIESAPDSDRFEVSCTFISGSSAHSCLLTVCEQLDDVIFNNSCINVTITRDPDWPTATQEVAHEFGSGTLTITAVTEVERDGHVTAVRLTSHSLGADDRNSSTPDITSSRVTTIHSSGTVPLGGVKSKGKQHSLIIMISAGAGLGLLAVVCVILTVVLTATWYRHHSRTKREVEPIYDEPYALPPKPIPVYEEPCAVVSSLKKTELHMEHCPAYGIVPNRHTS